MLDHAENRIFRNVVRLPNVLLQQIAEHAMTHRFFRKLRRARLAIFVHVGLRRQHALVNVGAEQCGIRVGEIAGRSVGLGVRVRFGVKNLFQKGEQRHQIMAGGIPSGVHCDNIQDAGFVIHVRIVHFGCKCYDRMLIDIIVRRWQRQFKFKYPIGVRTTAYKYNAIKMPQVVVAWYNIHAGWRMRLQMFVLDRYLVIT